ncbi:MAG: Na(+)-translocating NADH-quinone reductase subunit A [Parachlamydiaceae bacterium]|nr:Na(+)-translocating NADH-quinone reductase subunit A [Parachlamydiaceae bacterium]
MAQIRISKGLDIPIKGKPQGDVQPLIPSGSTTQSPLLISLNLQPFEDVKFKLLTKAGDVVKIGQPLAEDKSVPGRMFCSPAAGTVKEVRRGYKRALMDIIIETNSKEESHEWGHLAVEGASSEQIIHRLKEGGAFARIRSRPFNLLANPDKAPRNIFVKAVESAPFVPPAEMQVAGHESAFQTGLNALTKLTSGSVHLVFREGTSCAAFTEARNVDRHSAEGPHPIGTHSLHIQMIDPITSVDDNVWTLNVHDVIAIGYLLTTGRYFVERIISIAGPGVLPDRIGYFKGREGLPITSLVSGRLSKGQPLRLVSGDPLMGIKVEASDFLGFYHFAFCVIPESTHREFMHFFRLGTDKYSFSKTYVTGHLDNSHREYNFTTNQHGEHRPFIDATLYDKVMPLPISTMLLTKAVMAEDFELAEKLGFLGVDSEDFALPTFVCPSKMEMTEIIKKGLKQFAAESLG